MPIFLEVVAGPDHLLKKRLLMPKADSTLGSASNADIPLPESKGVNPQHARISLAGRDLLIRAEAGLTLNAKGQSVAEIRLKLNETFRIGEVELKFTYEASEAQQKLTQPAPAEDALEKTMVMELPKGGAVAAVASASSNPLSNQAMENASFVLEAPPAKKLPDAKRPPPPPKQVQNFELTETPGNPHIKWAIFSLLVLAISTLWYFYYLQQSYKFGGNGPSGGSWTGLVYGFVGYAMMLFCGMLGLRKRVRIWRLGKAQVWLRAHIWFGLLSYPMIFFHSGWKFGHGLSWWLMFLFTLVFVSGVVGVILQYLVPRYLLRSIPAETTFEQIPSVIEYLRREADQLITSVCGPVEGLALADGPIDGKSVVKIKRGGNVQGKVVRSRSSPTGPIEGADPLKKFYLEEIRPFLVPQFQVSSALATAKGSIAIFQHAQALVPERLHEAIQDIQSICEERRELAIQARLHMWLHSWLFVHIPISYGLLLLSLYHAIFALLYY